MKDYYKILGVDEEASGEEIRDRWIELTKRYHPDLSKGSDDEENIKEINEAYEVLKDFSKRLDYDLERALKRSLIKKAYSRKERKSHIRKILLTVSIFVFFIIVGLVIFRWPHIAEPPQSEAPYEIDKILEKKTASPIPPTKPESEVKVGKEVSKEMKEVMPQETTKIVSMPSQSTPFVGEREPKRGEESKRKILPKSEMSEKVEMETPKEIRKEVTQERTKIASAPLSFSLPPVEKESKPKEELVPQVVMKTEMPVKVEVPKEVPKEIPKEVAKEVPKEVPKEAPKEVIKEVPKEIPKEVPKETGKVILQEVAKIEKPKPIVTEPPPVQKPEPSVKAERVVSLPPPHLAKEEEVRQFFANYAGRYAQKDMKGFLSLFSPKAIQNQKEGFDEIQKIYTNFFDKSQDLQYHMEDAKIEIYQNRVEIKARFKVNQILKKWEGEKIWKGNIRWVLVKEDGALRIITLDYQNEKSP